MDCIKCSSTLRAGAKFCGNCGLRIDREETDNKQKFSLPERSILNRNSLPKSVLEVVDIVVEETDDVLSADIKVLYEVSNFSNYSWSLIDARIHLLDSRGIVVEEAKDQTEVDMQNGSVERFESRFWGIRKMLFDEQLETMQVVVSATAYRQIEHDIGSFTIHSEDYKKTRIDGASFSQEDFMLGGSIWKCSADEPSDSQVDLRIIVQNRTYDFVPRVDLEFKLCDKRGKTLSDAFSSTELPPAGVVTLSTSSTLKSKKLSSAQAFISIKLQQQCDILLKHKNVLLKHNKKDPEYVGLEHVVRTPLSLDGAAGEKSEGAVFNVGFLLLVEDEDRADVGISAYQFKVKRDGSELSENLSNLYHEGSEMAFAHIIYSFIISEYSESTDMKDYRLNEYKEEIFRDLANYANNIDVCNAYGRISVVHVSINDKCWRPEGVDYLDLDSYVDEEYHLNEALRVWEDEWMTTLDLSFSVFEFEDGNTIVKMREVPIISSGYGGLEDAKEEINRRLANIDEQSEVDED